MKPKAIPKHSDLMTEKQRDSLRVIPKDLSRDLLKHLGLETEIRTDLCLLTAITKGLPMDSPK